MKGYTSRSEISNLLLLDIDESYHDQVDRWIEWAENYIDQYTGRSFVAPEEPTERIFIGSDQHDLTIDDAIEVTKVEVGTALDSEFIEIPVGGAQGYRTLPPARYTSSGQVLPITNLALNGYWSTSGRPIYRITARWGYSEQAPPIVKQAATLLVAGILNASRSQGSSSGSVRSESIGSYSVTYGENASQWQAFDQLKSGLEFYRRIAI